MWSLKSWSFPSIYSNPCCRLASWNGNGNWRPRRAFARAHGLFSNCDESCETFHTLKKKIPVGNFWGIARVSHTSKTPLNVSLESPDTTKILSTHWWGVFGSGWSRIWPNNGPTCQRGPPGPGGSLKLWCPLRFEDQRGPFEATDAQRAHYELRRTIRAAQRASTDRYSEGPLTSSEGPSGGQWILSQDTKALVEAYRPFLRAL